MRDRYVTRRIMFVSDGNAYTLIARRCNECNRKYSARRVNSKYCSARCRQRVRRARRAASAGITVTVQQEYRFMHHKQCVVCMKRYFASRIDSKYCSIRCKQKAYRKRKSQDKP